MKGTNFDPINRLKRSFHENENSRLQNTDIGDILNNRISIFFFRLKFQNYDLRQFFLKNRGN